MTVYTCIILDIETGQTLHEESYHYTGPVAKAGGGEQSSSSTTKAIPTKEELKMQRLRLRQEKAMQPLRMMAIDALRAPSVTGPGGMKFATTEEAFQAQRMFDQEDIGGLTDTQRQIFEQFALPSLMGRMSAAGFGRSGAVGEQISNMGLQASLPLLQMQRAAQGTTGQFIGSLGNRRMTAGMTNTPWIQPSGSTTNVSTSGGGGSWLAPLITAGGTLAGSFFGNPGLGATLGGAAGQATSGNTGWNIPQMSQQYSIQ